MNNYNSELLGCGSRRKISNDRQAHLFALGRFYQKVDPGNEDDRLQHVDNEGVNTEMTEAYE
jgi:hypothetical protein